MSSKTPDIVDVKISSDGKKELVGADQHDAVRAMGADLIFVPTPILQQYKMVFWTRYNPGPLGANTPVDAKLIARVLNLPVASVHNWCRAPGFLSWFSNSEESKEKINYLFLRALDSAEEILSDPKANANAKVGLIKLLAEMTGHIQVRGGKNQDQEFSDAKVSRMSEAELKAWLQQKGVTVNATYQVKPRGEGDEE